MDHQQKDETAVAYLATAMNTKLARARAKGRSGWDSPECTQQHLSNLLREHVEKGDPVDVANFCAFLAARGEGIAPRQCLAQPIAGYRISDPSDPTIKPWLSDTPDDNGYTSEPLYAGAAPAAVAPQGGYPPLPAAAWEARRVRLVLQEDAYTAAQMRAYFDLGRQHAAAPVPEASAAPVGWISVDVALPPKNTEVVIWFAESAIPSTGQYTGLRADPNGWSYPGENYLSPGEHPNHPEGGDPTVTHWMEVQAPGNALAAAPQAPAAPWKDHQTARLVNDLRDCAIKYHGAGQLRERIAHIVVPLCDQLKGALAAPAAPAVDAETIEDAERFRAMAKAALTDDEVFERALDQHPDMGGDATIDDVRAMFDAAIAAQAKEGGA